MTERYELTLYGYGETGRLFTLAALAAEAGMHPDLVARYIDYGLIEPARSIAGEALFEARDVARLRTIQRLRSDLGVSLPGAAVIMDLLDRIERMQREIEGLRKRLEVRS